MNQTIILTPYQLEVLDRINNSDNKIVYCHNDRAAGSTYIGVLAILLECIRNSDYLACIAGKDVKSLKYATIPALLDILDELQVAYLLNGPQINFVSLEKKSSDPLFWRLWSMSYYIGYVDDAYDISDKAIEILSTRVRENKLLVNKPKPYVKPAVNTPITKNKTMKDLFKKGDKVRATCANNASSFNDPEKHATLGAFSVPCWDKKVFEIEGTMKMITLDHDTECYGAYLLTLDGKEVGYVYNTALEIVEETDFTVEEKLSDLLRDLTIDQYSDIGLLEFDQNMSYERATLKGKTKFREVIIKRIIGILSK